ncbi:MAG: hypothetical protein U1F35_16720 [Steroidobacteraceae bacterium]
MNGSATAARSAASLIDHVAQQDLLHFYRGGRPDYRRIAGFAKLSKAELGKLAGVAKASVRYDSNIPEPLAERLREIANIANLIAEFFGGDEQKVGLWFELPNPVLGNVSPRQMIRIGRYKRLLNFVVDARQAESVTSAR